MTSQEFKEYYKKNKTVVVGVPIIIVIVLINTFILKPAREKKRLERLGQTQPATTQQTTQKADTTVVDPASTAKQPIKMPAPIKQPTYPALSEKINERFQLNKTFPYSGRQRNIFLRESEKIVEIIPEEEQAEELYETPDLTYHGFFRLGANKVAILKSADRVLLTKVGSLVKSSRLKLRSILPDYVIITDTSADNREFEVALSSDISSGEDKK